MKQDIESFISQTVNSYKQIPGWFESENMIHEWINKIATHAATELFVLEIGSMFGRTTCFIAEQLKANGKPFTIYTVDPFDVNRLDHSDTITKLHKVKIPMQQIFRKGVHELGFAENIYSYACCSDEARQLLRKMQGKFHLVFVDGSLDNDCFEKDVDFAMQMLCPGGWAAGRNLACHKVKECLAAKSVKIMEHGPNHWPSWSFQL